MAKTKSITVLLPSVLLILALVAASCAPTAAPGENTAKVGLLTIFTGALATTGCPWVQESLMASAI